MLAAIASDRDIEASRFSGRVPAAIVGHCPSWRLQSILSSNGAADHSTLRKLSALAYIEDGRVMILRDNTLDPSWIHTRTRELFDEARQSVCLATDRLLLCLMNIEWVIAIALRLCGTRPGMPGGSAYVDGHVWQTVIFGGLIIALPCVFVLQWSSNLGTRLLIAAAQAMSTGLIIHLMDEPYTMWVTIEAVFLICIFSQSSTRMKEAAERQACLEFVNARIEAEVAERTQEIEQRMLPRRREDCE